MLRLRPLYSQSGEEFAVRRPNTAIAGKQMRLVVDLQNQEVTSDRRQFWAGPGVARFVAPPGMVPRPSRQQTQSGRCLRTRSVYRDDPRSVGEVARVPLLDPPENFGIMLRSPERTKTVRTVP